MNETSIHASVQHCPYLGLHDDPDTSLAYPSTWNFCYRATPSAPVKMSHQAAVCLTANYANCRLMASTQVGALPSELRGPFPFQKRVSRRGYCLIVFLLLFLALLVILHQYGGAKIIDLPFLMPFNSIPGQTEFLPGVDLTVAPHSLETTKAALTLAPTSATSTHPLPTIYPSMQSAFPFATTTYLAPPTNPSHASTSTSIDVCGHMLDSVFGKEYKFVIHQVAPGESLGIYADQYHTSTTAILAVNHFLPVPVWTGWVIVIPVETENVAGLPAFEPYQLSEVQTSFDLDDWARQLGINVTDLRKYNAIEGSCKAFVGWLIIPH